MKRHNNVPVWRIINNSVCKIGQIPRYTSWCFIRQKPTIDAFFSHRNLFQSMIINWPSLIGTTLVTSWQHPVEFTLCYMCRREIDISVVFSDNRVDSRILKRSQMKMFWPIPFKICNTSEPMLSHEMSKCVHMFLIVQEVLRKKW